MRVLVPLVLVACLDSAPDPGPVVAPSLQTFHALLEAAPHLPSEETQTTLAIDLDDCTYGYFHIFLGLGSGYALIHPTERACEIWLGGETENPNYDGLPTQYCAFARAGDLTIDIEEGGPLYVDSPRCILQ